MDTIKAVIVILFLSFIVGGWFLYTEIYTAEAQNSDAVTFEIKEQENLTDVTKRLEQRNIIRNKWLFEKYLSLKGLDKKVRPGKFKVTSPITLARVAQSLKNPAVNETEITIIPGWNLYDIAAYFERKNIIRNKDQFFQIAGIPTQETDNYYIDIFSDTPALLESKPRGVSLEGYLRPDTYKIYKDSSIEEIVKKLVRARADQFDQQMFQQMKEKERTVHEILTVASMLESEVKDKEDKRKVADILWRRLKKDWPLQMDSTVHYIAGKTDTKFTTDEQRGSLNSFNTYKYPGLPPGPISNPSLDSIKAAINPIENDYFYFLTDSNSKVHYAETLSEHNRNVQKYIRSN